MSHVEEVGVECQDLNLLQLAVERCGGELMRGQRTHAWWGAWLNDWNDPKSAAAQGRDPATFGTCDHAIRIKGIPGVMGPTGPWEIGVVATGTGYALLYDQIGHAGRQLEACFGADLGRLKDELAAAAAEQQLQQEGYVPLRTVGDDGTISIDVEF